MCQSESPNEAGNTWLVGWMISTGWYLKTRENQESSQQKTHTLLPSIRKSMQSWLIHYIFGGSHHCWRHLFPSIAAQNSFFLDEIEIVINIYHILLPEEMLLWQRLDQIGDRVLLSGRWRCLQLWWLSSYWLTFSTTELWYTDLTPSKTLTYCKYIENKSNIRVRSLLFQLKFLIFLTGFSMFLMELHLTYSIHKN